MDSAPSERSAALDASVWPFLVTRGRSVPYRIVLAPQFLIESDRTALLIRATGESGGAEKGIFKREVNDSRTGKFVVIFRIVPAVPALVGQQGDILKDDRSRAIHLTEGIVTAKPGMMISESIFERVHLAVVGAFRAFWDSDDRYAETEPSRPLDLDGLPADEPAIAPGKLPPIHYPGETAEKSAAGQSEQQSSARPVRDGVMAAASGRPGERPESGDLEPEANGRRIWPLAAGGCVLIAIIVILVLVLR